MSKLITHQSTDPIQQAVTQFKKKIIESKKNVKAILFFASYNYPPQDITIIINNVFNGININNIYWVSTGNEIMLNNGENEISNSIVFIGFTEELIADIHCEVIPTTDNMVDENINNAISSFSNYFGKPLSDLTSEEYICMPLLDLNTKMQISILNNINKNLKINIVGGVAGSHSTGETIAYKNGKYYNHASLVIIMKSKVPFKVKKIQAFLPTENKVKTTKVNSDGFTIEEFDNRPALEVFSEIFGINFKDISKERMDDIFLNHPFAIHEDDDYYIRLVKDTTEQMLNMYVPVAEGQELIICKSNNLINDTKNQIIKMHTDYNQSDIIMFHCLSILWEVQYLQNENEYMQALYNLPSCGFFCYGEVYNKYLLNRTITMLIFE